MYFCKAGGLFFGWMILRCSFLMQYISAVMLYARKMFLTIVESKPNKQPNIKAKFGLILFLYNSSFSGIFKYNIRNGNKFVFLLFAYFC